MASGVQEQLALKEAECESLRQQAAATQEAAAQALESSHRELQRLQQELFEHKHASIQQMKVMRKIHSPQDSICLTGIGMWPKDQIC